MNSNFLPTNYNWRNNGLYRSGKKSDTKICNAIPTAFSRRRIVNKKTGKCREKVEVVYQYGNEESSKYFYTVEQIKSGDFMKSLPVEVLIEPRQMRNTKEVFMYAIQKQISSMEIIEEEEYDYGWNQEVFVSERGNTICSTYGEEYKYALKLAKFIIHSNGIIMGCVLAAVHGPMKKLLQRAGIRHDFTTCISGSSGVGKTELASMICGYPRKMDVLFSLSSDRKELKKKIRDMSDITIIIDDFNKSDSERIVNRQMQSLAEIIQASSDAGEVLVDDSLNSSSQSVHIVITGESMLKNVSTINRCFWVQMDEPLSEQCWSEIKVFHDNEEMWQFMSNFMDYISQRFHDLLKSIPEDYKYYQSQANWIKDNTDYSRNRIVGTYSVQRVLFKLLEDYFKYLKLDERLLQNVNKVGMQQIHEGCQLVVDSIENTLKKATYTQYLPELADILLYAIQTERIANSEKKYEKNSCDYDFLCIHSGYISFRGKDICEKIAYNLKLESVSVRSLSRELQHFGLAITDTEGKNSFCWGTKKRMYHVKAYELLNIVFPNRDIANKKLVQEELSLEEDD